MILLLFSRWFPWKTENFCKLKFISEHFYLFTMESPQIHVIQCFRWKGRGQGRLQGMACTQSSAPQGPFPLPNVSLTAIANSWVFEIEPQDQKFKIVMNLTIPIPLIYLLDIIGHHWTLSLFLYLAWNIYIRVWMHCRIICSYINVNGSFTRMWFPWEPSSIVSF